MTRWPRALTTTRTLLVGAEKRSTEIGTHHHAKCRATTEPLVRILLAIEAHSFFNELTSGFVRRKRTLDRARDMSRLRRAKTVG
jgi:hypothetical protein